MSPDAPEARLRAYRAGYVPTAAAAPQDAGVRGADAHVAAFDPLRGWVAHPAWPAHPADVALGVDPGTYFCGGLAHALAARGGRAATAFIHVPPDAALPRPALLDLLGLVVAGCLAALGADRPPGPVLLTGFGPFPGVADNPTAAFVGDAARVAAAAGGLARGVVLALADADGRPYEAMGPVLAQLDAALAGPDPAVILALGVDSRQALSRPRFTVETQSRGMRERIGGLERPPADEALALPDLPLALLRAGAFRG